MKKITSIALCIALSASCYCQTNKVKGQLSTADTADISILNIYPDSFPTVSVTFKANTRKGEPLWKLKKEQLIINENKERCEVISLKQISKIKPINLGIVVDHSGSMNYDFSLGYYDPFVETKESPLSNAKIAIKQFVSTFNATKDFVSIVGFSGIVDKALPLTHNVSQINTVIDSMSANSATALYDAMITGVQEIKNAGDIKVLIALTDGFDNASSATWKDVIDKANANEIPIYIVGLGDVNTDTLRRIAEQTKGQFYYTKSSSSLSDVYAAISKQVQAFYEMVYSSKNISITDSLRQVELSFEIDSLYTIEDKDEYKLPQEVIAVLAAKEKQKEYLLYGGIGTATIVAIGLLLFFYVSKRRDKKEPIIKKLFPNPTNGIINVAYENGEGIFQIIDLNGMPAKSFNIDGNQTQFDLSDLPDGIYFATIISNEMQSKPVKFIIHH